MHETDYQQEDQLVDDPWRLFIHSGLILSAIALLLARPYLVHAVRANEIIAECLLIGPCIFLSFFLLDIFRELFTGKIHMVGATNYMRFFFGVMVIFLSFSSFREYQVRQVPTPMSIELIEKFSDSYDARIRALSILASSLHKLDDKNVRALIHKGLLDKDPLVQQAAKLVIEENFGIRLGNGAEGIHQAQSFIKNVGSSALLMRKGSP
jgi:hypothetical protein